MITRVWHGKTRTADADAYKNYVIRTGIQDYLHTIGNLGAQIWQREDGGITHIWTISWWKDYDSIRSFAGHEYEKAKYYDEDKKFLLEFEPSVIHCETFHFRAVSEDQNTFEENRQ